MKFELPKPTETEYLGTYKVKTGNKYIYFTEEKAISVHYWGDGAAISSHGMSVMTYEIPELVKCDDSEFMAAYEKAIDYLEAIVRPIHHGLAFQVVVPSNPQPIEPEYVGDIAGFPKEVVERMLDCQVEQGNKRDVTVFERLKNSDKDSLGFQWDGTTEKYIFWFNVIGRRHFDLFFKKYPKATEEIITGENDFTII